jgi:hypothetical protein
VTAIISREDLKAKLNRGTTLSSSRHYQRSSTDTPTCRAPYTYHPTE